MGWLPWGRKKRRRTRRRRSSPLRGIPILRWFGPSLTSIGILGGLAGVLTGHLDLKTLSGFVFDNSDAVLADTDIDKEPNTVQESDAVQESTQGSLGQSPSVSPDQTQSRSPDAGRPLPRTTPATSRSTSPRQTEVAPRSVDTIRVATFNIQMFGEKKSEKPVVMDQLATICEQFDVVAIQEIRGQKTTPIDRLIAELNQRGKPYQAITSQFIGSSKHVEAYGFVYNTGSVTLIPESAYLVRDEAGLLPREPMVASFRARVSDPQFQPFSFTLINSHTSPTTVADDAEINEMDVLDDVYFSVQQYERQLRGEDDCILLGDLNVDVNNLRQVGEIANFVSVGGHLLTNTARSKTYDHILINNRLTTEYRRVGVLDMQDFFNISRDEADDISDHQPLWADFSIYEDGPPSVAGAIPAWRR
ncbi:MAG: endonuclease/exonuclease/phosphatase family protein [Planctomycetota bacterium]